MDGAEEKEDTDKAFKTWRKVEKAVYGDRLFEDRMFDFPSPANSLKITCKQNEGGHRNFC